MKIDTLDKMEVNSTVDIIALVRAATDINEIVSTKLNGEMIMIIIIIIMRTIMMMSMIMMIKLGEVAIYLSICMTNSDWHYDTMIRQSASEA